MTRLSQMFTGWVYSALTQDFYGRSGFTQMGYWKEDTASPQEACENLVEILLDTFPDRQGPILEVGCGQGATTEVIARHFRESRVVATDTMPLAVEFAAKRLPGDLPHHAADVPGLRGGDLPGRDQPGAPHPVQHAPILRKRAGCSPGGRIALSDSLYSRTGDAMLPDRIRRNHLRDPEAYGRLLRRAGFTDIRVTDATGRCARAFQQRLTRWLITGVREGRIKEGDFNSLMGLISARVLVLTHYCWVGHEARTGDRDETPAVSMTYEATGGASTSRRTCADRVLDLSAVHRVLDLPAARASSPAVLERRPASPSSG
jgi:SAM-dependent methyltransferase